MKIYILKVHPTLQPDTQPFAYPAHNKDYGVEQDFLIWLQKQTSILTNDAEAADWHYLPVFWTRWYLNHNFAIDGNGMVELQTGVNQAIQRHNRIFTICQYDGGPQIELQGLVSFLAARTEAKQGIDIPILCTPHRVSPFPVKKVYTASFNGALNTWPIREEINHKLKNRKDVKLGGYLPTRFYLRWLGYRSYNRVIRESYISLSPRGSSMNSFRFFEAMQLGVAPCLIGEEDARPFKDFLPWDKVSYYASTVDDLVYLLDNLNPTEAIEKGKLAQKWYYEKLFYQKWCPFVLDELNRLPI